MNIEFTAARGLISTLPRGSFVYKQPSLYELPRLKTLPEARHKWAAVQVSNDYNNIIITKETFEHPRKATRWHWKVHQICH